MEDPSFKSRLVIWQILIVLLFPVSLLVCGHAWLFLGRGWSETYWAWRPQPRVGLPELSREQKWPYLLRLELEVKQLKKQLETPSAVANRGLAEAVASIDFEAMVKPIVAEIEAKLAEEFAKFRIPEIPILATPAVVHSVATAVAETTAAETIPSEAGAPKLNVDAVGGPVAAAAEKFFEQNRELFDQDPELEKALAKLRNGETEEPDDPPANP